MRAVAAVQAARNLPPRFGVLATIGGYALTSDVALVDGNMLSADPGGPETGCLREVHRLLRPGGRAIILEFMRPTNAVIRRIYEFFSNRVMPVVATWVSRDSSGAYRYLPRSVVTFLDAGQMCAKLQATGFVQTTATSLTSGVVNVYVATRS